MRNRFPGVARDDEDAEAPFSVKLKPKRRTFSTVECAVALTALGSVLLLLAILYWNSRPAPHPNPIKAIPVNDPNWDLFTKWLMANGSPQLKVTLAEFPSFGRGLMFTQNVQDEEILIDVPQACALNTERLRELYPFITDYLVELGHDLYDDQYLALMLLRERCNPESFWKPYIDILPKSYPEVPLNYTDAEMAYAQGPVVRLIDRNRAAFRSLAHAVRDLHSAHPEVFFGWVYNEDDVKWAFISVVSRYYNTPTDGWGGSSMVPLADLANHAPDGPLLSIMQGWAYVAAIYYQRKGSQFVLRYYTHKGEKPDATGLVEYGFLLFDLDEIPTVDLVWDFVVSEDDPLRAEKEYWLDQVGCRLENRHTVGSASDGLPDWWLKCLFIYVSNQNSDYESLRANPLEVATFPDHVRKAGYQLAVHICRARLAEYTASDEQDEELLQNPKLPKNVRNLVELRFNEKKVWRHAIAMAEEALEMLR